MARLKGFEPLTHGLEGRCSIQLSYRRKPHIRALSGLCAAGPVLSSRIASLTRSKYSRSFLFCQAVFRLFFTFLFGRRISFSALGFSPIFPPHKKAVRGPCQARAPEWIRPSIKLVLQAERCSMDSLSAIMAINSPLVGLSSLDATLQPKARFSVSMRPRLHATSMAWRIARST